MEFSKIKFHGGIVRLEWTEKKKNDEIEQGLTSHDEPEKEFVDALQAIGPHLCTLLGFAPQYTEGLTVTSISLRSDGCVVSAQKKIEGFNSPFNISTPHMKNDSEGSSTIPGDLARAVDHLKAQAVRYVKGHRVQLALPMAS